jgi:hypothetical protein
MYTGATYVLANNFEMKMAKVFFVECISVAGASFWNGFT